MDQNSPQENAMDLEAAAASASQGDGKAHAESQGEKSVKKWVTLVVFGILITIVAWISMVYNEYVSFYASLAGLIASVAGAILVGKGTWRSIAITSAIAAGVLFLVFVMLWAALSII